MTEAALKDRAMEYLRAAYPRYSLFWRQGASPFARSGIADILGVIDGVPVALEAKQPGRYKDPGDGLSPVQKRFATSFLLAGGVFIVFDDPRRLLRDLNDALSARREQREETEESLFTCCPQEPEQLLGGDADRVQQEQP
jgi:hypothetical protein